MADKMRQAVIAVFLLLGGTAVFVLGNPYYRIFVTNWNQAYYATLAAFLYRKKTRCPEGEI